MGSFSTQPNVLFLDDDADTRELVSVTLSLAGMNVVLAETRSEAWKLANEQWFELYLLDGKLPNGDSFQLCADLRELSPHTPIVFYSGLAFKQDMQRAFDAGASAYFTKPYEGDLGAELFDILHSGKSSAAPKKSAQPVIIDTVQLVECALTAEHAQKPGSFTPDNVRIFSKRTTSIQPSGCSSEEI